MAKTRTFTWKASERPQSYWLEQATLAVEYAKSRPPPDLSGFMDAMRDAAAFMQLAAEAA